MYVQILTFSYHKVVVRFCMVHACVRERLLYILSLSKHCQLLVYLAGLRLSARSIVVNACEMAVAAYHCMVALS